MSTYQDTPVENPRGLALLIPGISYPVQMPQLYFAKQVALAAGWSVREMAWEPGMEWTGEAVAAEVRKALEGVNTPIVLMGKSIGSLGAIVAAERSLPAVWITPMARREEAVTAIGANTAPQFVYAGTADPYWDHNVISAWPQNVQVLEFEGADHPLMVAGDPVRGAEIVAEYTRAVYNWLREL